MGGVRAATAPDLRAVGPTGEREALARVGSDEYGATLSGFEQIGNILDPRRVDSGARDERWDRGSFVGVHGAGLERWG